MIPLSQRLASMAVVARDRAPSLYALAGAGAVMILRVLDLMRIRDPAFPGSDEFPSTLQSRDVDF